MITNYYIHFPKGDKVKVLKLCGDKPLAIRVGVLKDKRVIKAIKSILVLYSDIKRNPGHSIIHIDDDGICNSFFSGTPLIGGGFKDMEAMKQCLHLFSGVDVSAKKMSAKEIQKKINEHKELWDD
jgi:hypothetical protein